jgi:hypothetical protein
LPSFPDSEPRTEARSGLIADTGSRRRGGYWRWLLVSVGWLVVVAAAFLLGYLLAEHDAQQALARIQSLQTERDMLSEQLAAQRDALTKLERSHQMDVQAQRAAQAEMIALQQQGTRLEQQVTHLRALVGAGGRGVVEVDGLVLTSLLSGQYEYRLTLGQLVPDFGRTEGEVVLSIVVEDNGDRSTMPLSELSAEGAGRHQMSFDHFQVFEGRFQVEAGMEPLELIVEILPKDDTLLASKEVVGWAAALVEQPMVPSGSPQTLPDVRRDGRQL